MASRASDLIRSTMARTPFERCGVRCGVEPEALEQILCIRRHDLARRPSGIKRQNEIDEAANDMRVAAQDETC